MGAKAASFTPVMGRQTSLARVVGLISGALSPLFSVLAAVSACHIAAKIIRWTKVRIAGKPSVILTARTHAGTLTG